MNNFKRGDLIKDINSELVVLVDDHTLELSGSVIMADQIKYNGMWPVGAFHRGFTPAMFTKLEKAISLIDLPLPTLKLGDLVKIPESEEQFVFLRYRKTTGVANCVISDDQGQLQLKSRRELTAVTP